MECPYCKKEMSEGCDLKSEGDFESLKNSKYCILFKNEHILLVD